MKKAQISLFIIVGLIVAMLIVFLLYSRLKVDTEQSGNALEQTMQVSQTSDSIRSYMQACVRTTSYNAIALMGARGFYVVSNPLKTYNLSFEPDFPVTVLFDKDTSYLPSKEQIESNISAFLKHILVGVPSCVNISAIRKIEPTATLGEMTATTKLSSSIDIEVSYPVEFKKDGKNIVVDRYIEQIPMNIEDIWFKTSMLLFMLNSSKDNPSRLNAEALSVYYALNNRNYIAFNIDFVAEHDLRNDFGISNWTVVPDDNTYNHSTTMLWTVKNMAGNKPFFLVFATIHKNNTPIS